MTSEAQPRVRRKNLGYVSYTSQVIAVFVVNFVAMATGVDSGRICVDISFNRPTMKTPYWVQASRRYFPYKLSYNSFYLKKIRCHGNTGHPAVNLNDTVKLAITEDHT